MPPPPAELLPTGRAAPTTRSPRPGTCASTACQTRAGFGFRRGRHIPKATSIQLKAMSGIRVMVRRQRVSECDHHDDVEDDQAKAF